MGQSELWIGLTEIEPIPGASTELLDRNGAYTNVVAWCSSANDFRQHAERAVSALGARVVELEQVEPLASRGALKELDVGIQALAVLVAQDRAPRVGTLHTWTQES